MIPGKTQSAEEKFKNELEIFRKESEEAAQCFYAHTAIHAIANEQPQVLKYLDSASLFLDYLHVFASNCLDHAIRSDL